MTYPTICEPCLDGRHEDCEVSVNPLNPTDIAAGVCGGGYCVCAHGENETPFQRLVWEQAQQAAKVRA